MGILSSRKLFGTLLGNVWLAVCVSCCLSCSSYQKSAFRHYGIVSDSGSIALGEKVSYTEAASIGQAVSTVSQGESSRQMQVEQHREETVHEHIVEQTDSLGTKTTTIDRTVHRDRVELSQQEWRVMWSEYEDRLSALSVTMDSLAQQMSKVSQSYVSYNDSLREETEKTVSNPVSWWTSFRTWASGAVVAVVCTLLAVMWDDSRKRKNGTKEGNRING